MLMVHNIILVLWCTIINTATINATTPHDIQQLLNDSLLVELVTLSSGLEELKKNLVQLADVIKEKTDPMVLTTHKIAQLTPQEFANLTNEQIKSITPDTATAINSEQLKALNHYKIGLLKQATKQAIPLYTITSARLSQQQFNGFYGIYSDPSLFNIYSNAPFIASECTKIKSVTQISKKFTDNLQQQAVAIKNCFNTLQNYPLRQALIFYKGLELAAAINNLNDNLTWRRELSATFLNAQKKLTTLLSSISINTYKDFDDIYKKNSTACKTHLDNIYTYVQAFSEKVSNEAPNEIDARLTFEQSPEQLTASELRLLSPSYLKTLAADKKERISFSCIEEAGLNQEKFNAIAELDETVTDVYQAYREAIQADASINFLNNKMLNKIKQLATIVTKIYYAYSEHKTKKSDIAVHTEKNNYATALLFFAARKILIIINTLRNNELFATSIKNDTQQMLYDAEACNTIENIFTIKNFKEFEDNKDTLSTIFLTLPAYINSIEEALTERDPNYYKQKQIDALQKSTYPEKDKTIPMWQNNSLSSMTSAYKSTKNNSLTISIQNLTIEIQMTQSLYKKINLYRNNYSESINRTIMNNLGNSIKTAITQKTTPIFVIYPNNFSTSLTIRWDIKNLDAIEIINKIWVFDYMHQDGIANTDESEQYRYEQSINLMYSTLANNKNWLITKNNSSGSTRTIECSFDIQQNTLIKAITLLIDFEYQNDIVKKQLVKLTIIPKDEPSVETLKPILKNVVEQLNLPDNKKTNFKKLSWHIGTIMNKQPFSERELLQTINKFCSELITQVRQPNPATSSNTTEEPNTATPEEKKANGESTMEDID